MYSQFMMHGQRNIKLVVYCLLSPLNSGVGADSPCRLGYELIHAESTDKSGRI